MWNVDKTNNTIDIVSANATSTKVTLRGADGFNNGVRLLNEACSTLYANSSKGITARSLDGVDLGQTPGDGSSYTFNIIMPNRYTGYNSNELRPGTEDWLKGSTKKNITVKSTYTTYKELSSILDTTKSGILGSRECWLASRYEKTYSNVAIFGILYLTRGGYNTGHMIWSYTDGQVDNYTYDVQLTPLASLGSAVQLVKNSSGIWVVQ